jgi:hypothetical protein
MVFSAEWKRPSGAVAVTPWHKYVQSLLCKYGVDVEVAAGRACATDDSSTAVAAAAPEQYNQGTSFEVAHSSAQMQHS